MIRVIGNPAPDAAQNRPARPLEHHNEHRHVQALVVLAANSHTPRIAVADVPESLPPAELARIIERVGDPDWFLNAAAAVSVDEDEDDGVLRLMSNERRRTRQAHDPAAVLQSWLDSPATGELLSRSVSGAGDQMDWVAA
ncbi:hypothetical protein ACFV6B_39025 [Streptomyces microflavus]|uniref:hypothetical protein n=1 Tax=Streptomyces microflavus TaxID=1919 RepID=UPI00364EE3CF